MPASLYKTKIEMPCPEVLTEACSVVFFKAAEAPEDVALLAFIKPESWIK